MQLQFHLDADDFVAGRAHIEARLKSESAGRYRAIQRALLGVLIGVTVVALNRAMDQPDDPWHDWWLLGSLALILISALAARWWSRGHRAREWLGRLAGDYTMTLSPGGLNVEGRKRSGFHSWRQVLALDETDGHWLVYVGRNMAIPIPKAAMAAEQATAFFDAFREYWSRHPDNRGRAISGRFPEYSPRERFRRALGDNLIAGMRLAFWRPVAVEDFRVGHLRLFWLFLIEFAGFLAYGYALSLPSPSFNIFGVTGFGANVLVFVLSGVVLASLMANQSGLLRLLVVLQSGSLIVTLFTLPAAALSVHLDPTTQTWFASGLRLLIVAWMLAVVFRAMGALYLQPRPVAGFLAGVFALLNVGLASYFPQMMVFNPDYGDEWAARERMKLDVEETYYRQTGLVDHALSGLKAQRPGVVDLYFVGFAGQAEEKVFSNEVRYARRLMEQRFDLGGRTLALINHQDAVADTPLANTHNLKSILKGVATRMDRDEDVLFLFLTSHGARNHTLSVSFWPLELNDLKAEELKTMLDASGIRNRVIVVSACYSGGFLDVLKDDDTLIVTASSRDKVSYGCGDGTEYTYFSEAYFVKSLATGNDFIDAFGEAKELIAAREKSEGREHSDPQMHVGRNIAGKLVGLEGKGIKVKF